MKPIRLFITAALVALAVLPVATQTSITIQPATIARIVNGTITAGTVQIPSCKTMDLRLNITTTGTATGTLQVFVEDSTDGGTTWNDLVASNTFTFGAAITTQRFALYNSVDGPGLVRVITGSVPGAGAEISETVPAGVRWELLTFRYSLTTSATVGNRFSNVTVDDGATVFITANNAPVAHVASSTFPYSLMQASPIGSLQTGYQATLPARNQLLPGHRIKTLTTGLLAGDQYTAPLYSVKEWRDAPGAALAVETAAAGTVRAGAYGERFRIREKVSGIAGGPVGPTYAITAACQQ